jgi:hypothetical protein
MSANTSPKLKLLPPSSKTKPEAIQEIRDSISVDPCLDLPNALMRPYLAVPSCLMELFLDFHLLLGSWKVESFVRVSPTWPLFELNQREYDTIIYGSSTLGTRALFLVCGSSPRLNKCSYSSFPLKAKYVDVMGKGEEYNSSYLYCQAKGWSKKS